MSEGVSKGGEKERHRISTITFYPARIVSCKLARTEAKSHRGGERTEQRVLLLPPGAADAKHVVVVGGAEDCVCIVLPTDVMAVMAERQTSGETSHSSAHVI
jgi:hypothetical protein